MLILFPTACGSRLLFTRSEAELHAASASLLPTVALKRLLRYSENYALWAPKNYGTAFLALEGNFGAGGSHRSSTDWD
jgi:hypothetical protein